MVMTPNVNPYSLAKQNDNKVYSNRVISVMKKTVLFVFCGFYDWRSKSKQFVRKLITLWMCSDLLICKAAGQKIFTEVLLGLMVKARRSAQCWCSAEQYEGALGSAWVRDGEHTAVWPHEGVRNSSLKHVSPSLWEHVPSFTDFIQGCIRKPLLHFGTTYSLLYLLCLRWAHSSVSAPATKFLVDLLQGHFQLTWQLPYS